MSWDWVLWYILAFVLISSILNFFSLLLSDRYSYYKRDIIHRLYLATPSRSPHVVKRRLTPLEALFLIPGWVSLYFLDQVYVILLGSFRYIYSEKLQDKKRRYLFASLVDWYNLIFYSILVTAYFFLPNNEIVAALCIVKFVGILAVSTMMVLEIGLRRFKDYSFSFTRNISYTILNFATIGCALAYLLPSLVPACTLESSNRLIASMTQLISFNGLLGIEQSPWLGFVYSTSTFILFVLFVANISNLQRPKDAESLQIRDISENGNVNE